jgi:hypothetical protein
MTLIVLFVRLQYSNDFISTGVLVAFSMKNSSLVLLLHESPDNDPGLLGRHLTFFNAISILLGLLLMHVCTLTISCTLTCLCCLVALCTCICIKHQCHVAIYFGGKTRHATMQHMTVGVVSVEEEYFRAPLMSYLPLLGIPVNWYLVAHSLGPTSPSSSSSFPWQWRFTSHLVTTTVWGTTAGGMHMTPAG